MEKFKQWLFTPLTKAGDKIQITLSAFMIKMGWFFLIVALTDYVKTLPDAFAIFFYYCFITPLWEELAFRVIPITIAKNFGQNMILPVIGLSAIIFGFGHPGGLDALLVQGIGCLVYSIVYIKSNYNYWLIASIHAAWNIWAFFWQ